MDTSKIDAPYKITIKSKRPQTYVPAFMRSEVVKYKDNYYFIGNILQDGLELIELDNEVYKSLKKKGLLPGQKPKFDKMLPSMFLCEGCGRRRLRSGRIYGKSHALAPLKFYCKGCQKTKRIIPFYDMHEGLGEFIPGLTGKGK